MQSQLSNGLVN